MPATTQSLLIGIAAALAISAAGPAAAETSLGTRVATGVGRYIAAQGNAALAQIRTNWVDELAERIKLYVPEPPAEMAVPPNRQPELAGRRD